MRPLANVSLAGAEAISRTAALERNRVYGQNESYDPATDKWESHAPILTPRRGMGAVVIGDSIYVAGGGPQMGGGVKSAINEAFTLS